MGLFIRLPDAFHRAGPRPHIILGAGLLSWMPDAGVAISLIVLDVTSNQQRLEAPSVAIPNRPGAVLGLPAGHSRGEIRCLPCSDAATIPVEILVAERVKTQGGVVGQPAVGVDAVNHDRSCELVVGDVRECPPLCRRRCRSSRRSSRPSPYMSHVTPSTPAAASRLKAWNARCSASGVMWWKSAVRRSFWFLSAAFRIRAAACGTLARHWVRRVLWQSGL